MSKKEANFLDQTHFDVIVQGIGLTSSILAAACANAGLKVLHLDANDFYGMDMSAFSLPVLLEKLHSAPEHSVSPTMSSSLDKETGTRRLSVQGPFLSPSWTNISLYQPSTIAVAVATPSAAAAASKSTTEKKGAEEKEKDEKEGKEEEEKEKNKEEKEDEEVTGKEIEQEKQKEAAEESDCSTEKATATAEAEGVTESSAAPHEIGLYEAYAGLDQVGRRFTVDVAPAPMFSVGPWVDSLVRCAISCYVQFKTIADTFVYMDGESREIPCSKSDVFRNKYLSLLEKRQLMKFFAFCMRPPAELAGELAEYASMPYVEFLTKSGPKSFCPLGSKLVSFVLHGIAQVGQEDSAILTPDGLSRTMQYARAIGRFGPTPYIFPLYGLSEFPQAFARACAVKGGYYVLRRNLSEYVVDNTGKLSGVVCSVGQSLTCEHVITTPTYLPSVVTKRIARCVCITASPLQPDTTNLSVVLPPRTFGHPYPIDVLQLSQSLAITTDGYYMIHLSSVMDADQTAEEVLRPAIAALLNDSVLTEERTLLKGEDDRPSILSAVFFTLEQRALEETTREQLPSNLIVCQEFAQPSSAWSYGCALQEAEELFKRLCPDKPFLPEPERRPDDEGEEVEVTADEKKEVEVTTDEKTPPSAQSESKDPSDSTSVEEDQQQ
mmetsp:Transcript_19438/g.49419  ORF Transcript_19438/g.49419 Transcript_19438/m.49419 type:complete len:663 (-) Transcript_19438:75-2063(-)|eukprot:CAMPEP_0177646994 /NCGR_PEP_ID=MMETSP0447-20121125/10067_1 /TAXON_ID=0 /ORGANISM="Stygamoeba regulata, Strain BSH-02190019" /LENGTH=662 /DNA_ID=CAMNT_0019149557 /DNA_START=105 /DNA_END=2093 /DNA_ORIENTATION=-